MRTDTFILVPAEPAERCYLSEVLYWRAFGRLPVEAFLYGEPWRFSAENLTEFDAPIPDGPELTVEECTFAGLSADPRLVALEEGAINCESIEICESLLAAFTNDDPDRLRQKEELAAQIEMSKRWHKEIEAWQPLLDAYLDEFKNELCLDLRRGKLVAKGVRLPAASVSESEQILEDGEMWLTDLPVGNIPAERWVSTDVEWLDSAIYGRVDSYVWIHVSVADILALYPPDVLIDPQKAFPIGSSVAVVGKKITPSRESTRRGRPSLPWQPFHVEVARLYATGEMPGKKEAAIALLMEWFLKTSGIQVSRSAIGSRLKPYFDKLGSGLSD